MKRIDNLGLNDSMLMDKDLNVEWRIQECVLILCPMILKIGTHSMDPPEKCFSVAHVFPH